MISCGNLPARRKEVGLVLDDSVGCDVPSIVGAWTCPARRSTLRRSPASCTRGCRGSPICGPRPLILAWSSPSAGFDRRRECRRLYGPTPAGKRAATTENTPSTRRLPAHPAPGMNGLASLRGRTRCGRGDHRVTRTAAGSLRQATTAGIDSPGRRRPERVGRSCLLEGTANSNHPGLAISKRLLRVGQDLAMVAWSSPRARRIVRCRMRKSPEPSTAS